MMYKIAKICVQIVFCLVIMSGIAHATTSEPSLHLGIPLFAGDEPLNNDFIDRLNRYLRPDDILLVRGEPRTVRLLKRVKYGKVALIRQSISDLKKDLELLLSHKVKVDYLCYNPEAWKSSHTPKEEKDDPVKAVISARRLADENGLGLMLVPDTALTLLAYGAEMAPYADIFIVQFQRWQRIEEDKFQKFVSRSIWWVKSGNPDVPIFALLSTNPPRHREKEDKKGYVAVSAAELMARVKAIEKQVVGLGIFLRAEDNGFDRLFEFLEMFRPAVQ